MSLSIYDQDLGRNAANHVALSPVSFIERMAEVFGDLPSVVRGACHHTWAQARGRSAIGLGSALGARSVASACV